MADSAPRRLLVAASGSGGHIYPGLAVARAFADLASGPSDARNDANDAPAAVPNIRFVGDPRRLETRLVPAHGFPLDLIPIPPLRGRSPRQLAAAALDLPGALLEMRRLLRDFRPAVVFGTGGAVSGVAALAARLAGIPSLVLEPNADPGLATRLSAPCATEIAVGFAEGARHFPRHRDRGRVFHSGIPVRAEFLGMKPPAEKNGDPLPVLITGGSQGASRLNRTVVEALPRLRPRPDGALRFAITHQTGPGDEEAVRAAYDRAGVPATVAAYLDDMPAAFRAAGLVVARGGAITCAELAAAGRPGVIVPTPVAGAHQEGNARTMEQAGAAATLPDGAPGADFAALLLALAADRDRRRRMAAAARRLSRPTVEADPAAGDDSVAEPDAATRLARRLLALGDGSANPEPAR